MNRQWLALYGLKWNPFSPELPIEGLHTHPAIDNFCWRIEHALVREGGFALVTGEPGTGKSVTLRLLAERLSQLRDITVGVITHPSSNLADFYREMGDVFGVELRPHNRWGGFKALRERWLAHLESTLLRPVLLTNWTRNCSWSFSAHSPPNRAEAHNPKRRYTMNRLPLEMMDTPPLTDEGAAQCLDFLYQLTAAFEQHYAAQLRKYYEPQYPAHPDLFDELEEEPLPF